MMKLGLLYLFALQGYHLLDTKLGIRSYYMIRYKRNEILPSSALTNINSIFTFSPLALSIYKLRRL